MTEEMVDILDENDKIIDTVPRSEMRKKNLKHASVYFMIFNKKGEILIAKRTMNKDMYPGLYEIPGGSVSSGESYEETVHRELEEEFQIKDVKIKFLFKFTFKDEKRNDLSLVYSCVWDGELTLQEEEVDKAFFVSPEELKKMIKTGEKEFAKHRIILLEKYFGEKLQ